MFFTLSKIAGFLIQPSSLLVLAIAVGLVGSVRGRRWTGVRLASGALGCLVVAGLLPVGNLLIVPLEERFAAPDAGPGQPVAGIIILGGFEDGWVAEGRGQLVVNEAAERLTEGARLALGHPNARVVFTGGVGGLLGLGADASGRVGRFLREMGVAAERLVLEGKSRNTYENALFTRELVKPRPGERWLLVTSAYHMPRSMGVFRRTGFDVAAYPVDYRTRHAGDVWRPFNNIPAGLERLDLAAKEWIGLVAYRLSGRTDALFPGP